MINVGDVININGDNGIIKEINKYMIVLENGLCYTHEEVYLQLYEQQKQRADQLEKMWNDLKEHVTVRADMCLEKRLLRERNVLIDVMAAMHDLEEDGE